MTSVVVNSEKRTFRAVSIQGMVEELGLPAAVILVEHNGVALRRSEWETSLLSEEDRIEIIRVAAGG